MSVFRIEYSTFNRSIVGLVKITPLIAADTIIDRYYGKNPQFTRAVSEMRFILEKIRTEKSNHNQYDVTNEPPKISRPCCNSSHLCKQLKVSLHRLTAAETVELCTVIKQRIKRTKKEWGSKVSKHI